MSRTFLFDYLTAQLHLVVAALLCVALTGCATAPELGSPAYAVPLATMAAQGPDALGSGAISGNGRLSPTRSQDIKVTTRYTTPLRSSGTASRSTPALPRSVLISFLCQTF